MPLDHFSIRNYEGWRFSLHDHRIYTLNGKDGILLWSYYETEDFIVSSPALGDLDDDGKLEVVIGSGDHRIYAFDFPSAGAHAYWQGFSGTGNFSRIKNIVDVDPDSNGLATNYENLLGIDPLKADTDGGWFL